MQQGKVKWFNEAKGFGFITGDNGTDVFVHYSAIKAQGFKVLTEGQLVRFESQKTPKGMQAVTVEPL